jgi:hypothetical protein
MHNVVKFLTAPHLMRGLSPKTQRPQSKSGAVV